MILLKFAGHCLCSGNFDFLKVAFGAEKVHIFGQRSDFTCPAQGHVFGAIFLDYSDVSGYRKLISRFSTKRQFSESLGIILNFLVAVLWVAFFS